jgi:hypothetical protein
MISDGETLATVDASAAQDWPAYRKALRLGFERRRRFEYLRTYGVLMAVTCVPLLILALSSGLALGNRVELPLLRDPGFYSRYIVVLPLLLFAEVVVTTALSVQAGYLLESGIVPEREHSAFRDAEAKLKLLYNSRAAQAVIVVSSYALALTLRTVVAYSPRASSWERLAAAQGGAVTTAGWWSILFCIPIIMFLILRWLWRAGVWAWFLLRVSRFDLELTPTHPDRAGGLGFLTWGQASFAPVLAAVSALLSGSFASQVLYAGESLHSLKYHVAVFVALALAISLAPLLVFSRQLAHCRFKALLDFGMLVGSHDRAFDAKWIRNPGPNQEKILGCADASSLVELARAYEHVQEMRVIPLDRQAILVLLAAAVVPLVPFVATTIPVTDILRDLGVFMV